MKQRWEKAAASYQVNSGMLAKISLLASGMGQTEALSCNFADVRGVNTPTVGAGLQAAHMTSLNTDLGRYTTERAPVNWCGPAPAQPGPASTTQVSGQFFPLALPWGQGAGSH